MLICAACPGVSNGSDNSNVHRQKYEFLQFFCIETQIPHIQLITMRLMLICEPSVKAIVRTVSIAMYKNRLYTFQQRRATVIRLWTAVSNAGICQVARQH
jgi:hypothetical protein